MRLSEWISLAYFLALAGLAARRPVGALRVRQVRLLGALGVLLTLSGRLGGLVLDPRTGTLLRDWIPAATVLPAYWQAGRFFTGPSPVWQRRLESADARLGAVVGRWSGWVHSRPAEILLEAVYCLAYPLVPAGLVVIELLGRTGEADRFWSVVLLSCYGCYAMLPFVPTLPPRLGPPAVPVPARERTSLGRFNLWILRYLGIQANTFPSGHVAATTATSLIVLETDARIGILFVLLTAGIAVAAVALRYHFFLDVVVGAVLALAVRAVLG